MSAGFHTITLGCKLNQFDGAAIEGELARRGLVPQPEPVGAAVVVINTCTVTHRADADARKLIRSVRRGNPSCVLLVTGCLAERDADALRAVGGVDRIFGNREKPDLPAILDEMGIGLAHSPAVSPPGFDRGCDAALGLPDALHFGQRSRAFLKIQEGCRLRCSYCIIPEVRGPSRSVGSERIVRAAASLAAAGYSEIVLTGVNTGDYGRDLDEPTNLAGLLRRLLSACGAVRFRLNSLEPRTVTGEIVDLMACEPRLASHLQIPLQSGSDAILRRMRRNYDRATYLDKLRQLEHRVPRIGLGADVMVGFPGETDALFESTLEFVAASPLNYLHVFSWSPRPGTPASLMRGRLPEREISARSRRLRRLAEGLSVGFRERCVGQIHDAVVLDTRPGGRTRALTGNFIEVSLEGSARRGELVDVRIDRVTARATFGAPVGRPAWGRPVTA